MSYQNVNTNTFKFDMAKTNTGVYFVEVIDSKGIKGTKKIYNK